MELTRITNDVNGNPRYVVHFLEVESKQDKKGDISNRYAKAVKKANKIGGRKYHTKGYGGGIVFQSYNTTRLKEDIKKLRRK